MLRDFHVIHLLFGGHRPQVLSAQHMEGLG